MSETKKDKRPYIVSSMILKGGSGKTFSVYMFLEYIRDRMQYNASICSKRINRVLACDMDTQISLIGKYEDFANDRRTVFYLKNSEKRIKVKHQEPTLTEEEKYDLIVIDNSPEYQKVLENEEIMKNTNLFIVPVNSINALDRVQETIDSIREIESKYNAKESEIVLLFIDTMHVHKVIFDSIDVTLSKISKRNKNVQYWGNIKHSKKVSLSYVSDKPLYKALSNVRAGIDSKKFAKYVLSRCFNYYGYKSDSDKYYNRKVK